MNSASNDFAELVIERLAKKLCKCPFDGELFMEWQALRGHLCESHASKMSQSRLPAGLSVNDLERPARIYCCLYCDFIIPEHPATNANTGMRDHILAKHPNQRTSFRFSDDARDIYKFMEQAHSVCVCTKCDGNYTVEKDVADHWLDKHCDEKVGAEEVRSAIDSNPDRYRQALAKCRAEVAEEKAQEEIRCRFLMQEPDDGYVVHHLPNVPRVRSAPGETIIYVERESVSMLDREIEEQIKYGVYDGEDEVALDKYQRVKIELRFCNIEDGYIPRVKEVLSILPPQMADGEMVDVSWEDEPSFPCKVSRSKRAIYNVDRKLSTLFKDKNLLPGTWLYITRVETRRYKISARRQRRTVPNCKVFVYDDATRAWNVERRDEIIEWETSDHVFKYQLNYPQMDALRAEAQATGLSIKDAVYKVMKQLADRQKVHVMEVYFRVFWDLRTCSLAAVWAQFRPEHDCYERIHPGYYRFNPSVPLSTVRFVPPVAQNFHPVIQLAAGRAPDTRIRILVRWSHILGQPHEDEEFLEDTAGKTQARFIGRLLSKCSLQIAYRLKNIPVSRGHYLSANPQVDFAYNAGADVYSYEQVPGTDLYLLTNTENREKYEDIKSLVQRLGFSADSVEVFIIPGGATFLASI